VKAFLSTGKQRNLLASAGLACRMIDHAFHEYVSSGGG
jgi:hypothetical protein